MDSSIINIPTELVSKTKFFDAATPISKLLKDIGKHGAVVVTRSGKYHGIIDNRALYRADLMSKSGRTAALKFAQNVPSITDDTSVDDALLYFYKSRAKALPYTKNGRVAGIIKRFTLLKMLLSLGMLNGVPVNETMTSPVIAINADSMISQAKAAMRDNRVSRLVVMQSGKLYGIVTNHDIIHGRSKEEERLPERAAEKRSESDSEVSGIANRNLIIVGHSKDLAAAAREMVENNVSSVVVLRSGNPVGILTIFDIFGGVIARRNVEEWNIFISGIDGRTKEYENDIKETLRAFMARAEALGRAKPLSILLNLKLSGRRCEMHARLTMEKGGTLNVHATDYTIEKTMDGLLDKLMRELRRKKERNITVSRTKRSKRGMDLVEDYEL
ncbi:MAG: CBS domain-containing protein [Candidatus Marsarchaeota archaeon]|nr:CBS domain-containing protein [Candidatus Marsarchaeota archaeon]MCL5115344.1 CBS domain-containing protein [Candidatus Marsarchaeota archaeon]